MARRLTRMALRYRWRPVGAGVMPAVETDHLIAHLFGGDDGASMAQRIDNRVGRRRMFVSPTGKPMYDHTLCHIVHTAQVAADLTQIRPSNLRHTHTALLGARSTCKGWQLRGVAEADFRQVGNDVEPTGLRTAPARRMQPVMTARRRRA